MPSLKSQEVSGESRNRWSRLLVVMVVAFAISSCGGGVSRRPAALAPASTDSVKPAARDATARSMVMAALDRSLSLPSAVLTRHAIAGYAGIWIESVDRLEWNAGSGRSTSRLEVDEKYLTTPEMRDYVDSLKGKLSLAKRDLDSRQLDEAFAGVRQAVVDMLDSIEADGSGIEPLGLGWWTGTSGGIGETQQLSLQIRDGMLVAVEFSIEVIGSTATDSWELSS